MRLLCFALQDSLSNFDGRVAQIAKVSTKAGNHVPDTEKGQLPLVSLAEDALVYEGAPQNRSIDQPAAAL
jgi:hypothetical protein